MSRALAVVLATGLAPLPLLGAQGVLVAPHAVYIDHRIGSGSILLYNPNAEPAEVTIATLFGYPVTDSAGALRLHIVAEPGAEEPSAAAWLQAFPRRLTVGPLERQTVRLLATPPAGLPEGEYWARLAITAKGGRVPIAGVADTGNIRVGLSLEVRTIIGVSYRKGRLHTGVALSNLRARVAGDSLEVRARLERQGTAAFIGTLRGELVDSAGTSHARFATPLGVYYALEPRFAIHVGALPAGRYRLRIELDTRRDDLTPDVVLPAPAVRDSVELRLP